MSAYRVPALDRIVHFAVIRQVNVLMIGDGGEHRSNHIGLGSVVPETLLPSALVKSFGVV